MSRRRFLRGSASTAAHVAILSALPAWVLGRQEHTSAYLERSFYTMGAVMTISAYGESRAQLHCGVEAVVREFGRLEALFSVYQPKSSISSINRAAGKETVPVERDVIELLLEARRIHALSRGAFDVTIEPLMKLWGFRGEAKALCRLPDDRELQQALDRVGIDAMVVDEKGSRAGLERTGAELDLGGIAVGFALDRAAAILRRLGIRSAFVNHSGDAYALGSPEDSDGWDIGIPNPLDPQEMLTSFRIRDRAVSTSGNYEKYVEVDSRRYGHILDPGTGCPAETVLSQTVLAPSALEADAWSTALFSRGVAEHGGASEMPSGCECITVRLNGLPVPVVERSVAGAGRRPSSEPPRS